MVKGDCAPPTPDPGRWGPELNRTPAPCTRCPPGPQSILRGEGGCEKLDAPHRWKQKQGKGAWEMGCGGGMPFVLTLKGRLRWSAAFAAPFLGPSESCSVTTSTLSPMLTCWRPGRQDHAGPRHPAALRVNGLVAPTAVFQTKFWAEFHEHQLVLESPYWCFQHRCIAPFSVQGGASPFSK